MLTPEQRQQLTPQVRQMQIIVAAMAMGILMFALITLVLTAEGERGEPGILTLLGIVVGLVGGVMGVLIPRLVAGRGTSPTPATYLTKVIIACAFFEGAAFFNLVAFMIEQHYYALFMAILLLGGILLQFPTVSRVAEWIDQLERSQRELQGFER